LPYYYLNASKHGIGDSNILDMIPRLPFWMLGLGLKDLIEGSGLEDIFVGG
jgi:hypothetical protein